MVDTSPFTGTPSTVPLGGNFYLIYRAVISVIGGPTLPGTTTELEVDYDARRTPYVQARAVLAWPATATMRYLDPDLYDLSLAVHLGYQRITTGLQEVHRLAQLRVQAVVIDYLAQTVTVEACSDDGLLAPQASLIVREYGPGKPVTTYVGAVQQLVGDCFPGETLTWAGTALESAAAFTAVDTVSIGDDIYDAVTEYTDAIKAEVRHDGLGTWQLSVPPSTPSGTIDAYLTTGARGNVTAARIRHDRAAALTDLIIRWDYAVTGGTIRMGYSKATTGRTPRSVAVINRKRAPMTPDGNAAKLLARGLRRGHVFELEAIPMFWLRPYDTITAVLPAGVQTDALVERVRFTPHTGTMTVSAQVPARNVHASITGSGAGGIATP